MFYCHGVAQEDNLCPTPHLQNSVVSSKTHIPEFGLPRCKRKVPWPLNPQNCRKMQEIMEKGTFFLSAPNSGVHQPSFKRDLTSARPYPQIRLGLSGRTPETLSERFLEFPSRVWLGSPKPYNSRHLKAPEHFQNYLPPSTAGDASLFRSGSGEGLSEPVMEFPAVLGAFLICLMLCATRVETILGILLERAKLGCVVAEEEGGLAVDLMVIIGCPWRSGHDAVLLGSGRSTVGKRAGTKWSKMVQTTILVRTGF